tara:strand:- start:88 stop:804 length:717 start_codon:yes stop_codon:yes gene_type:complete
MKKTIFTLIIIILVCLGCEKNNPKFIFLGNWSSTSDTNFEIDITFSNDSILINNPIAIQPKYSTKWKIIGDKIKHDESVWDFKFNTDKDTLWIKHETDSIYHLKLKKINDGYEYFENRIGLQIKLKKNKEDLTSIGKNDFGFNIYLSLKNNELIAKTDNSKNLNRITYETFYFKDGFPENEEEKLKYVLFIDKRISERSIDSVKSKLLTNVINKIFVVYDYKENEWNDDLNWFGKFEN